MNNTYVLEALGPFSGDQRPARTGVYLRKPFLVTGWMWSYYNARTKLWGVYCLTPARAYQERDCPSCYQRLTWFALPEPLDACAHVKRLTGVTFRVTL